MHGAVVEPALKLPEKIRDDTLAYRRQVERFLRGELSPAAFRVYRVSMGVYEQRQAGTYMVRIRIGAGRASSAQLRCLAQLSQKYGNGVVHITTRQDFQIHDVQIEQTPDVLEGLLGAGLSSRGNGGNAVRNITACPRAGVCPCEQFDVAPHALALAQYLLQFDSSYNLPRKFKIAFSGCAADCALASVADLGFFAHRRNGMKGFAVYAGGGLGAGPAVAVQIEEFVEEHEIFEVAATVKRLFETYGDRANTHRARLRHVLARFGPEEFARLYRKERERVKRQGLEGPTPEIAEAPDLSGGKARPAEFAACDVLPEKHKGFYTFRLILPLGDIPAEDLLQVAQTAETCGTGAVRTTQQQDLLIPSVPKAKLGIVQRQLQHLRFQAPARGLPKVVVCAGAATCKPGLCLSQGLAQAITDALARRPASGAENTTLRISGCPNSCGQHLLGELGFQGRAQRVNGRLMPCYDVFAGAQMIEGGTRLAEPVGTLPARKIPEFVAETLQRGTLAGDRLRTLVEEYARLPAGEIPEDYYRDWGAEAPFSLAGRGPGECGAGVLNLIRVDLDEAAHALDHAAASATDPGRSESLHRGLLAAARALLVLFGAEPKTDAETFAAFRTHLIEPGWVEPSARSLLDEAARWHSGNGSTLTGRQADALRLFERVSGLFLSLDANLRFTAEPAKPAEASPASPVSIRTVDLRGVPCPLNFVQAKMALEKTGIGDILEIEIDDGEPIRNLPVSLGRQGQEILATTRRDNYFCLKVRRRL
jgi:sulfite reductase (ferredoxin)